MSAATRTPGAARPSRRASVTKADSAAVEAVEAARAAAEETAGAGQVGDYLGHDVEGERVVTHFFACTAPGYIGWRWSVTVARASRAKTVTISEVLLLPGGDALLAPAWVPWDERLRPGDLGPGDLLPTTLDDYRLAPGYTGADEAVPDPDDLAGVAYEIGLGRELVLSREGRDDAADRWYSGDGGPEAPIAQAAPAHCVTCAFLVRLGGPLAQAFGVCTNEMSPSDGRVVSYDHGCGAHSSVRMPSPDTDTGTVLDTLGSDPLGELPDSETETGHA